MTTNPERQSVTAASAGSADVPLLTVDNGELFLAFAPEQGGRLLSLRSGGVELLWRNPELLQDDLSPTSSTASWPSGDGGMGTWANVGGSKTWPAPQGWDSDDAWAGPPDPVLDSGSWTASVEHLGDSVRVQMVSPSDPRTGLRITRQFDIAAGRSGFAQRITFENTTSTDRRWSIWEVCQIDTAAGAGRPLAEAAIVVPTRPGSRVVDLGVWHGSPTVRRSGHDVRLPIEQVVAKHGFTDVLGSVRWERPDGIALTLHADPEEDAVYPDGGAQVEVWMQSPVLAPLGTLGGLHPSAHLAELEILGPLVHLPPGASSSLEIAWTIDRPRDGAV